MATYEPIDLNQPDNKLTQIANNIRKTLIVKNDYDSDSPPYSVVNPDAISDGDIKGKGTGVFLDSQSGGNSIDNLERVNEIKINKYQADKPYQIPAI